MKKALIIEGGWDGHTPKEVAALFGSWLEEAGVNVTISDTLEVLDDYESLKQYDLFVPCWTMGTITNEQCDNICRAVAEGAGMAGCHGGMCDAFRDNCNWQFMTGSQFVAHPGYDGTDYDVHLLGDNPFTQGLEDFHVCSEQYYLHVDPCVKVWATTRFPVADGPHTDNGPCEMPVIYTKKWGKGRIYYNALGHTYRVFDIPEAKETMRRGLLWAMR